MNLQFERKFLVSFFGAFNLFLQPYPRWNELRTQHDFASAFHIFSHGSLVYVALCSIIKFYFIVLMYHQMLYHFIVEVSLLSFSLKYIYIYTIMLMPSMPD